jgi:hypothetical protein
MSTSPLTTFEARPRSVKPGLFDVSVGREMMRVAQEGGQKSLSAFLGQWEMIITFFKHGLEIPLCINQSNETLRDHHRLLLTGIMGMGEMLLEKTKVVPDKQLEELGYSREFIKANVRYLRDTYQQWYADRDAQETEAAYLKICDALSRPAPANSSAPS